MGTPANYTLQLSVTRSSTVRFADKNNKSLIEMLKAYISFFVWHWSFRVYISFKLPPDFSCVIIFWQFWSLIKLFPVLVNLPV